MDAKLARYGKREILSIFYSSTDGCDWDEMIVRAKQKCNVGSKRVLIMFEPVTARRGAAWSALM